MSLKRSRSTQSYGAPFDYGGSFRTVRARTSSIRVSKRVGGERRSADGTQRSGVMKLGMYQKAKGVSPYLKKAIKAVVDAGKEKKDIVFQVNNGANISVSQTAAGTPPQMFFLAPVLLQGDGQGERNGNIINVKEYKLRFRVGLPSNSNYAGTTPMRVTVWVGNLKGQEWVQPVSADFQKLLHITPNTEYGEYSIEPETSMLPVNAEYWNIVARKTYMVGYQNGGGAGGTYLQTFGSEVRAFYEDEIDIRSMCKRWTYDDNSNYPRNMGMYMFVTCTLGAGSTMPTILPTVNSLVVGSFTYSE